MTKLMWRRRCHGNGNGCPDRIAPVDRSIGLTGEAYCCRTLNVECDERGTHALRHFDYLGGRPVVAGYRPERLIGRNTKQLHWLQLLK